jgi:phage-related protein
MSSLRDFADYVSDGVQGAAQAVTETASAAVETVTETASAGVEAAQGAASETSSAVQETASEAYQGVQETASDAYQGVQETASEAYQGVQETASEAYQGVQETASEAYQGVQETASEAYEGAQGAVDYVGGAVATAGESGSPFVNSVGNPDDPSLWDQAKGAVSGAVDAVEDAGAAALADLKAADKEVMEVTGMKPPSEKSTWENIKDGFDPRNAVNALVNVANKAEEAVVTNAVDYATEQGVISQETGQTIKNVEQVAQGVRQGVGDLVGGALNTAANPLTSGAELIGGKAVKGYEEGGGGVTGVLNAANELSPWNLMNPVKDGVESVVKAYEAAEQGNYKEAGRQGTHAVADAAAVAGAVEGGVEPVEPTEVTEPAGATEPVEPAPKVRVGDDVIDETNAAEREAAEREQAEREAAEDEEGNPDAQIDRRGRGGRGRFGRDPNAAQDQLESIEHAQRVHRRAGRPSKINETTKSRQRLKDNLKNRSSSEEDEG